MAVITLVVVIWLGGMTLALALARAAGEADAVEARMRAERDARRRRIAHR